MKSKYSDPFRALRVFRGRSGMKRKSTTEFTDKTLNENLANNFKNLII